LLAEAPSLAIVFSEDLAADIHGIGKVEAIADLALLTARIGQPRSGIYPLYRHINAQGALDMGVTPFHYPGHLEVTDARGRERLTAMGGGELPTEPGLGFWNMVEAAEQKRLRCLYIMGENPLSSEPRWERIKDALQQLDFLVVQDIFLSQTAKLAHVVLPATGFVEQEGTFTNTERRVQRLRAALASPGGALPDWRILADLGAHLDTEARYAEAESVYQEIMAVVPFYQGLTYERLEGGGLQWPYCPEHGETGESLLSLGELKAPLEFAVPH
jgi:predicted molibdopterin-dependent oxidoreductase YjgC